MTEFIATLQGMVGAQIVQVTLVIVLAGVFTRLVCRNRPYLALALWTIVLVKCVVPPIVYSPCGVFCWMDAHSSNPSVDDRKLDVKVLPAQWADAPAAQATGGIVNYGEASISLRVGDQTHVTGSRDTVGWATVGLAVWLAGALVVMLVYIVRSVRFQRHIQSAGVDPAPNVERLVRRLSRYVGLRHVPRLVISRRNVGPAVFGVVRPTIILPRTLVRSCSLRQLTPIVLHELIHVRRGDLWLSLHSILVRSIWWFHPLVWWSVRRAEWESERCCDESVVACMQRDPARYAYSLIDALEQSHRLRAISLAPGVRPVEITATRLERIMRLRHGSHKRMPVNGWISAVLAAALVLPGAAGGLAQSPETDEKVKDLRLPGLDAVTDRIDPNVRPAGFESDATVKQGSRRSKPVTIVRVYKVADLLEKLKQEESWPEDKSDQLKLAFVGLFQRCSPALAAHMPQGQTQLPPGLKEETRFSWNGDQLVVSATESVHELLANELANRRRHSFRHVTVEVRIMHGHPNHCLQTSSVSEDNKDQADWRHRWILFQQEFANAEPETQLERLTGALVGPRQDEVPNRPSATASSGKSNPIVHQFMDDVQVRSFIGQLEGDRESCIVHAPKVTLFDGQSALITDASQRPFVTDVTQVVGPYSVAYQPVIKVLWEGIKIQLTPTITPDGHRLNCRFMFASIDDCKSFRPPRYPEAEDIVIQHPVVTTNTFECGIDVPTGQTLLIGGLFPCKTEREVEQGALSRLFGQQPKKILRSEVTYIVITPRTLVE